MAPQEESVVVGWRVHLHGVVDELREVLRIGNLQFLGKFSLQIVTLERTDSASFTSVIAFSPKSISAGWNDRVCVELSYHNNPVPSGALQLFQRFHREVGEQ